MLKLPNFVVGCNVRLLSHRERGLVALGAESGFSGSRIGKSWRLQIRMGSLGKEECYEQRSHLLLLPVASFGHEYPFMQILFYCSRFENVSVTVASSHGRIAELARMRSKGEFRNLDLRLEEVFGAPPMYPSDPIFPIRAAMFAEKAEEDFQSLAKKMIEAKNLPGAVTAVVADMYLSFTQDLAGQLGVPWFPLYVSSPQFAIACLEAPKLHREGLHPQKSPRRNEFLDIPGLEFARVRDLPHEVLEFPKYYQSHSERMHKASAILFNTAQQLDAPSGGLDAVRAGTRARCGAESGEGPKILSIGPMLQFPGFACVYDSNSLKQPSTQTELRVMEFLDTQAPSSVLYISFGSFANISAESVTELAHGVEASGVPFIWALKLMRLPSSVLSEVLPPGFEERTRGRGLIETGWAPQAQILLHPSTGGFLSHCGWSSVLESLGAGVPIITWPLSGDQPLNARFVDSALKAGIPVKEFDPEDQASTPLPSREDVRRAVSYIMLEGKGQEQKEKAKEMQKVIAADLVKGGPSNRAFQSFLDEIMKKPQYQIM